MFANMGWAPYPSVYPGVPGRSSVGGANIGVSAYGPRPDLAVQAAVCMTRPYWQNQEAINEGLPPVLVARLSPKSTARAGEPSDLWLDATRLHFFDAQSGDALTFRR